ncbi:addiction module protein [Methylomonas koyamae]|uniref:addiction module protein n=1 Tax=Methylomonas koyamae TaxID=702114 RepID=UPI0009EE825D
MNNISISDILELPIQERIQLVELIWDSIAAVPEALTASPAVKGWWLGKWPELVIGNRHESRIGAGLPAS